MSNAIQRYMDCMIEGNDALHVIDPGGTDHIDFGWHALVSIDTDDGEYDLFAIKRNSWTKKLIEDIYAKTRLTFLVHEFPITDNY